VAGRRDTGQRRQGGGGLAASPALARATAGVLARARSGARGCDRVWARAAFVGAIIVAVAGAGASSIVERPTLDCTRARPISFGVGPGCSAEDRHERLHPRSRLLLSQAVAAHEMIGNVCSR
jgi:hypothetical protein